MDDDLVFSESEKPRYLLPEGCKDLYDVIRRQEEDAAKQKQRDDISEALEKLAGKLSSKAVEDTMGLPDTLGPCTLENMPGTADMNLLPTSITVPDPVTVGALAELLHVKWFRLVSVLIKLKIFVSADSVISFPMACRVCSHFGVEVKSA
ncbi:hypothetical protein [Prosthecobacter sp.]|uniref:hypothetical protein n=1 Tax=Prosthecobacter sp. TaxID=1965333 RepID=UPI0037845368